MSSSIPNSRCPPKGNKVCPNAGVCKPREFDREDLCAAAPLIREPACMDFDIRYSASQGRIFNASTDLTANRGALARCPNPTSLSGDPYNLEIHMAKNRQKAWDRLCIEEAQKLAIESQTEELTDASVEPCPVARNRRRATAAGERVARGRPFDHKRQQALARVGLKNKFFFFLILCKQYLTTTKKNFFS